MSDVMRALGNAFRSILHPQMLALAIWPMLVALVLWVGLAWLYGDSWAQWLGAALTSSDAGHWLSQHNLERLVHYSALMLLLLVLAPLVLITALLIVAVIEMPLIVNFVAARDYPALDTRRGGTLLGSSFNALFAVLVFAGLWIVTLPLWLTGVLVPVVPVVLSAYLTQRLFRYDALSDHASAEEYRTLVDASWGRMYGLGFLLALLYYVPIFNLLMPVMSGLAFTHLCLAGLARLRQEGVRREV
jgi:CysZ protein